MDGQGFCFRGQAVRLAVCLSLILLFTFSLAWSVPQQEQEINKPLQYNIPVVLKLITVYVTDKKGNPVEDLGLEDFVVTDNGQLVRLTEFEKHRLKTAPVKASGEEKKVGEMLVQPAVSAGQAVISQPRKFFLLFDFAFNNAKGIVKAKKAAQHFMEKVVRADDEVGILSYSMIKGITFHEYLTKDHDKVRQVIDSIGSKDIAGRASEIEEKYWIMAVEPMGTDIYKSRNRQAEREEAKQIAENYILRMTALAQALRYEPGQKHFIVFSTGIPSSMIYGGQAGNPSSLAGSGLSKFDAGDRVLRVQNENMYKEFAAANCDIYAFDTRESTKTGDIFAYDSITFEENHRNNSRGIFTTFGVFGDQADVFRDEKTLGGNSLKRMTDLTGGKYFSNINLYEKNLGQVQAMTGTYYIVGYYISEIEDGRFHEVKVEVKRPGCEVRSQSGYFSPKPFREYTNLEKTLHLFDLALNERSFSRLPISFPISCLSYASPGSSELGILARIPGEVTVKFEGERVEYVVLIFDAKNNIRDIRRLESDSRPYRGRPLIFTLATSIEPGEYTCRLVIRDMESGLSAVSSAWTSVPVMPSSGLKLGTPLLLHEESGCVFLEAGSDKGRSAFPWKEIYAYDQTTLVPIIGEIPGSRRQLLAVIPFSVSGSGEADVALSAQLIEAATGQVWPVAASLVGTFRHNRGETAIMQIPLPPLKPGDYFFYVNGVDRVSKTVAYNQVAFTVRED